MTFYNQYYFSIIEYLYSMYCLVATVNHWHILTQQDNKSNWLLKLYNSHIFYRSCIRKKYILLKQFARQNSVFRSFSKAPRIGIDQLWHLFNLFWRSGYWQVVTWIRITDGILLFLRSDTARSRNANYFLFSFSTSCTLTTYSFRYFYANVHTNLFLHTIVPRKETIALDELEGFNKLVLVKSVALFFTWRIVCDSYYNIYNFQWKKLANFPHIIWN